MDYTEYTFAVEPAIPGSEILIAELEPLGFESFVEIETGLQAYHPEEVEDSAIESLGIMQNSEFRIHWEKKVIPKENWNATWEENFSPVNVDDRCIVRASFHEKPENIEFDIVIDPKMSFGTGHHETTHLVISEMLNMDLTQKSILDMGSGTGVLAILAAMKGAEPILAIDNEEWAYHNAIENAENNNTKGIDVKLGDSSLLGKQIFNIILANINLNVLLNDIGRYAAALSSEGQLLMSGFFDADIAQLKTAAEAHGLVFAGEQTRNNWAMVRFTK